MNIIFWARQFCTVFCVAIVCLNAASSVRADAGAEIVDKAGVEGGLVVHLGSGDGQFTAQLRLDDRYLVQGLEADPANVAAARSHIQALGLYGQVSVRQWNEQRLPYGDNLVNLLVISEPRAIDRAEIQRVLCPRGVAVTLDANHTVVDLIRKPVPEEIDDWTHYLHDPGNNAVAQDERVGPPRHLQWKSGPMWSRSHEFASSVQAMVSANGRLLCVIDEGIIGQPRGVPTFWTLIARDAFNGMLLWKRPCDHIPPHALAAVGDRVYVTIRSQDSVSILDAATGKTLHECQETGKVSELAVCEDRLILSTQLPDEQGKTSPHIAVADPENGRVLWQAKAEAVAQNTMVAGNGRICYYDNRELVCLAMDDGRELWRSEAYSRGKGYAVLYEDAVFLTGGSTRAFALGSGELLWTGPDGNPHARNPPGLFGADGLIWRAWDDVDPRSFLWQHREETRNGYNPTTGEIDRTVTAQRLVTAGHHIRCYPAKATSRYLLLNKRGVEFLDLRGDNHMRANWTRGACGFGMLPANGFLYTPPAQCFCYQGVLLAGLNALAAKRDVPAAEVPQRSFSERLVRGPAYAAEAPPEIADGGSAASDWPTYRHDARRSGSIDVSLPVNLERRWETPLCAPAFPRPRSAAEENQEDVVLLSASAAEIHGAGATLRDEAIISWRGADTFITWQTQIDRTGELPVWICQSNAGQGGSTFELAVGDEKLAGEIRHTNDWAQYVWVRVGDVRVPQAGAYTVSVTPTRQVEGRLGNVRAVAIGGQTPPAEPAAPPALRERPRGGLTPPVAAGGLVFVAEPDAHAVHALNATDGSLRWTFYADGRVDSPPTLYEGLCLFGSTDGHVYCLSASDGRLAWRFQAAPEERQLCIMSGVESAWPVHGSVLVRDGLVYCTAGRSSYLDGGIYLFALNPHSGLVVHDTRLWNEEPDVTKFGGRPFDMEGARSDLLVAGEEDLYLYQNRFNPDLTAEPMPRITKLGDRQGEMHLMTTDGFLDKTWFNRTYWTHSERWPGYYFTYRGPKSGQILVFDDQATYALKVYTERRGHSPEFQPGTGYHLIADRNTTKPVLDVMDIGAEKGRGFSRTELPIWLEKIPIRAHGMLAGREHLYVVGPPDLPPGEEAYEAMIGKRGATFRVVSKSDGSSRAEFSMDECPVFDGLIAAGDRLYMTTMEGTLICWGERQ
jgi:outer membrane protein assembly factor BamB